VALVSQPSLAPVTDHRSIDNLKHLLKRRGMSECAANMIVARAAPFSMPDGPWCNVGGPAINSYKLRQVTRYVATAGTAGAAFAVMSTGCYSNDQLSLYLSEPTYAATGIDLSGIGFKSDIFTQRPFSAPTLATAGNTIRCRRAALGMRLTPISNWAQTAGFAIPYRAGMIRNLSVDPAGEAAILSTSWAPIASLQPGVSICANYLFDEDADNTWVASDNTAAEADFGIYVSGANPNFKFLVEICEYIEYDPRGHSNLTTPTEHDPTGAAVAANVAQRTKSMAVQTKSGDNTGFLGDVWNHIEEAASEVTGFAINAGAKALKLAMV
jgi:hypothetical protein